MDFSNLPSNATTPKQPSHFWNKKFLIWIVLLLLIGGGAYAGIYNWQQTYSNPVVPTFTPRANYMANWKTYTNTQYGFEFKLPQGWIQNGEPKTNPEHTLINFASPEAQKSDQFNFYGGELNIWISPNPKKESIDKFFGEYSLNSDGSSVKSKTMIIDGRLAKRYYDVEGESASQIVVIDDGSRFIELEDTTNIIDQILLTFKFIDISPAPTSKPTTIKTTNWKTYTNSQYGFEFKYPSYYISGPRQNNTLVNLLQDNTTKSPPSFCSIILSLVDKPSDKTVVVWRQSVSYPEIYGIPSSEVFNYNVITIDGKEGIEEILKNQKPNNFNVSIYLPVSDNSKSIFFSYVCLNVPNASQSFDQVISSFKFTK